MDYWSSDEPGQTGSPTPAEQMTQHGSGSWCDRCKTVKCQTWKDAHVANIMSEFLMQPTVAKVVHRAE